MMKAFNTFNIDAGIKFATYASRVMQNEILMALRKLKRDAHKTAASLDETIHEDGTGNELSLMDMVPDSNDSIENQTEDRYIIDFIIKRGKEFLDDKEYYVIMNYLKKGEVRQRETASELNVSQSYVSRLFAKAINKIRKVFDGKDISTLKKTIVEKEPEIIMEAKEKVIEIPSGTLYEKIKYLYVNYPEMSFLDMADLLNCNKNSVRSYLSQIKRELENQPEIIQSSAPTPETKEEPKIEFKEQQPAPSVNELSSPSFISLSLEGASAESIQFMLQSIAGILKGGDTYSLNIDISKNAKEAPHSGDGSKIA